MLFISLVPLHYGPSKRRLRVVIFSVCFEGNENHELMFMLGTNVLAPYATSYPPLSTPAAAPERGHFSRYGNAPWTCLGKISPHFELAFRNPFLRYNFKGFPVSFVCHICKSFSSGYIFAGSSSFNDCFLLVERKHFIGKIWVKKDIFSPCWYQGVDWNKHVLPWKPNHVKKGAAQGGRSSTNSAGGTGSGGSRWNHSQLPTLPLCWGSPPCSLTRSGVFTQTHLHQHQFINGMQ